jgi:putative flippase GtrA
MKSKQFILQACKYGVVGVANTLLTAVVIWVLMRLLAPLQSEPLAITLSNIAGYIAGLINSFVWNRKWTFRSQANWKTDFLKFIAAFLACYIPQLILVMLLNQYAKLPALHLHALAIETTLSPAYLCQLIGIVFYTALNFLSNKYYTFK